MGVQSSDEITLGFVVDIKETKTYYKMQSSTADPPSLPTTNPPAGWSATEPAHTMGAEETLYFTILTVFTDDSFSYSDVSVSASFQAAEDAAKIATNYMRFENGKGLVIGDMTNDELGQNTLIDSEGVAIREGEDESARFSKDKVSLLDGAFEFTAGREKVDMVGNTIRVNLIDSNVDGMHLQNGAEGGSGRGKSKSNFQIFTSHDTTRPLAYSSSTAAISSESKIIDGSEEPTHSEAYMSLWSIAYPCPDFDQCSSEARLFADDIKLEASHGVYITSQKYPNVFQNELSIVDNWITTQPDRERFKYSGPENVYGLKQLAFAFTLRPESPTMAFLTPRDPMGLCVCEICQFAIQLSNNTVSGRNVSIEVISGLTGVSSRSPLYSYGTMRTSIQADIYNGNYRLALELNGSYKVMGYIRILLLNDIRTL